MQDLQGRRWTSDKPPFLPRWHIHPIHISLAIRISSPRITFIQFTSLAIRISSPRITFIQFTSLLQFAYPVHASHSSNLHLLQFAYPVHVSHIRISHIQSTNYIIRYPVLHSIPGEERASEMFVLAAGDTAHRGRQIIPAAQTFPRASFTCSPKSPPLRPSRG